MTCCCVVTASVYCPTFPAELRDEVSHPSITECPLRGSLHQQHVQGVPYTSLLCTPSETPHSHLLQHTLTPAGVVVLPGVPETLELYWSASTEAPHNSLTPHSEQVGVDTTTTVRQREGVAESMLTSRVSVASETMPNSSQLGVSDPPPLTPPFGTAEARWTGATSSQCAACDSVSRV